MSYVDPKTVTSPKSLVSDVEVIYDSGPQEDSWSVAALRWGLDKRPAVGIRWNGGPGVGSPQSRGLPTWFVVPEELSDLVREAAEKLANGGDLRLISGYQQMASDQEREMEAIEWSEGLIGDASAQE
jgi:hypothetical protein